eukprot:jgi/Tetstr1/430232/TSEL_020061.t1
MVDTGKAASVKGVEASPTAQARIEAGRREAEDARMRQLTQEQLSRFFATQETHMPPVTVNEEDAIPGGNESRAGYMDRNFPDGEYYHDACYGAFIAGLVVELRKLLAAACVTNGITPAFGEQLHAVGHSMYGRRSSAVPIPSVIGA